MNMQGEGPAGDEAAKRFGFIAIIGAPNVGKSTLVNALVGTKVTIVSHKVQTTRVPIRGIAVSGGSQIAFVDTPGIFSPRRRLDRAMVDAAWSGAGDADLVALMVDAVRGIDADTHAILQRLKNSPLRKCLIVNKIDKQGEKDQLLVLVSHLTAEMAFERVFMISAIESDGLEALLEYFADAVPQGPWHYPEDEISDLPVRLLAAEITREQAFLRLHDELPYALTVEPAVWKDLRDGSVRIEQTIYVERDSQKKIVLGHQGQTIKAISQNARQQLMEVLERRVHLFLFVKVRERWAEDPERYREIGLEYPKDG
ncbi:MAG: GTPase Era [Pseudomonadota bacterium]|jgi:GTP-binding protein Era